MRNKIVLINFNLPIDSETLSLIKHKLAHSEVEVIEAYFEAKYFEYPNQIIKHIQEQIFEKRLLKIFDEHEYARKFLLIPEAKLYPTELSFFLYNTLKIMLDDMRFMTIEDILQDRDFNFFAQKDAKHEQKMFNWVRNKEKQITEFEVKEIQRFEFVYTGSNINGYVALNKCTLGRNGKIIMSFHFITGTPTPTLDKAEQAKLYYQFKNNYMLANLNRQLTDKVIPLRIEYGKEPLGNIVYNRYMKEKTEIIVDYNEFIQTYAFPCFEFDGLVEQYKEILIEADTNL